MNRALIKLLDSATIILFIVVLAVFGALSPRFFTAVNLQNLMVQSSSTAVVAIGMTFVLLTAGVDLSVGAIMFIAAAIAGKLLFAGFSLGVALAVIIFVGIGCGALNGFIITRLGIMPFIGTLGTLYAGRGFGLWVTQTRAMNLPGSFLHLGSAKLAGVPLPLIVFAVVVLVAHVTLQHTPLGRQLYALGNNPGAARKAGLNTRRLLTTVYVISGFSAAIGSILSLTQLGAVSPTFGVNREFAAIAAAVLGGTSLFGGRGAVFPGTVLGALLIQSIENGLVILNADPYLYPLLTAGIIFLAVFIDSMRNRMLADCSRRHVYLEPAA